MSEEQGLAQMSEKASFSEKIQLIPMKMWIIISVVAILVVGGIVTATIMINKEDNNQTKDQVTKNPSAISALTKSSDSLAQNFAQVGDESTVSFPNNIQDGVVPIKVKVTRILKLVPEAGRTSIDLRACSNIGCHPMYAVEVIANEALAVLDLEFTNSATDTDRAFWAYFQGGLEARFKVDGTSQDVFSLKNANNQWFEEKPSFYIEPMKTMKVTFWTRVQKETKNVEFVYAKDFSQPILSIPMSFEPTLSANEKVDQELQKMIPNSNEFDMNSYIDSIQQSGIFADSFRPYRKQIDNREPTTCTFRGKSPGDDDVTYIKLTIDGEKFRWAQEIRSGNEKMTEGEIYDGMRDIYIYSAGVNMAKEESVVTYAIDVSCFKKTGIFPSVERIDNFRGPFEDVLCQPESNPDFSLPSYDQSMVRSVENGNCQ